MFSGDQASGLLAISQFCVALVFLMVGFGVLASQLLLASWLDHLGDMVEQPQSSHLFVNHLKVCMAQYNGLNSALGIFFLFNSSVKQFTWILGLYLSLSGMINTDEELQRRMFGSQTGMVMQTVGMLLVSCGHSWHLFHMTSGAEHLRARFRERGEEVLDTEQAEMKLRRTAKKLATVGHLSACGFFDISRSTLGAMTGTAVTYLIILVQFKSGTPVTPK